MSALHGPVMAAAAHGGSLQAASQHPHQIHGPGWCVSYRDERKGRGMTTAPRALRDVLPDVPRHWVGDGFPVRTMFSYPQHGQVLSPFLLMDWAGPAAFEPTDRRRGVGDRIVVSRR